MGLAKKLLLVIFISSILSSIAVADVIVFENYKTTFQLNDNSLKVTKYLRLKNVGPSPIIPGEIHFKISEDKDGVSVPSTVNNFVVENAQKKKDRFQADKKRKRDRPDIYDLGSYASTVSL